MRRLAVGDCRAIGTLPGSSVVYFLKSGDFVKIGVTANLEQRMRDHAISNPNIELMFTIPFDERNEKALHELFKDRRHKGEWFRFGDLLEGI
jgi:hypothetical protein